MSCLWKGKRTKELDKLYEEYWKLFGRDPEGYIELEGCYDMSYEEYVGFIKECIKEKKAMPYVVYPDENPDEWDY